MRNVSLLLFLFLLSCSTNSLSIVEASPENITYKITEEDAVDILNVFLSKWNDSENTKGGKTTKRIENITAIRGIDTKSEPIPELDVDIDTLLYAINFEDNAGFALIAADRRTEPVWAIIDNGRFDINDLTADEDMGFLMFLEGAILKELEDIQNYKENPDTKSLAVNGEFGILNQFGPKLETNWGQSGDTYGQFCPNERAGCVAAAIAQILSYYKTPNEISWSDSYSYGHYFLDWDRILSDCRNNNGKLDKEKTPLSASEVAALMRYLGAAMKADYSDKSETTITDSKAIDWINDFSLLKATKPSSYNDNSILSAISNNNHVLVFGNAGRKRFLGITISYTDGHTWVIDSMTYGISILTGATVYYVHCNWGWAGRKNGYYLHNAFNTLIGAEIYESDSEDQSHKPEEENKFKNYQYNLKYSVISSKY